MDIAHYLKMVAFFFFGFFFCFLARLKYLLQINPNAVLNFVRSVTVKGDDAIIMQQRKVLIPKADQRLDNEHKLNTRQAARTA